MKYDKFFALAKEAGIEEAELYISESYSLEVSLFHSEINNYSVNNGSTYFARGIINGKFGAVTCDVYNNEKAKFMVDEIVKNAGIIENDDPAIIFKGSEKYKKVNVYNKELDNIPVDTKIKALFDLEAKLKTIDNRVIEIEGVEYAESRGSITLLNSYGLKLTQKFNYFVIYGSVLAKEGEQVKSGFDYTIGNDYSKLDIDDLAKRTVKEATDKLGGKPCESKVYKAVLAPEVINAFLNVYMGHANAEQVQKNSSLFKDKIGQKVASKKVTIEDKPLLKGSINSRSFDDEGVATYNKFLVKNGILQGYLYDLKTAAKDGVQSTGNGMRGGSKISVEPMNLVLKAGRKSFDELVKEVGDGVYITEVQGLHAGMNAQSGNFSLQSTGFLIKDGKVDRGLDVITVSGNLVTLFNDILEVGSDVKELIGGALIPSVIVKKLNVGGK